MDIVIWGTGQYYCKYKKYIDMSKVIAIVDNNPCKWGSLVDGMRINNPNDIDYTDDTYVLILVKCNEPIVNQLLDKGISLDHIKNYLDIASLFELEGNISACGKKVTFDEWERQNVERKKFFVLSNGMSRTGVPIALMNLCCILQNEGYGVIFGALGSGNLKEELELKVIGYIEDIEIYEKIKSMHKFLKGFDCLVFGSVTVSKVGSVFSELGVPVIWWLHESLKTYYDENPLPMKNNIHYYGVGQRVIKRFHEYYPNTEIGQWAYGIPNILTRKRAIGHTVTFASIGMFCERKGQDILLRAIQVMSDKEKKQARFVFVGSGFEDDSEWVKTAGDISQIEILGEQTREEVERILSNVDVLVCPSRDDPMPIVVTEAMQHYIPCIVSNEVGQSAFMEGDVGGFVFESEDVEALSRLMKFCIDCPKEIEKRQSEAYKIYCDNFLQDTAERKMREIINKILN